MTLLNIANPIELQFLNWSDWADHIATMEEFVHLLKLEDAHWQYQGPPRAEAHHVILNSGKHSDGFINCPMILRYPVVARILANTMVRTLRDHYSDPVDWVVGAAYACDPLIWPVAEFLHAKAWPAEKVSKITIVDGKDSPPSESFTFKRFPAMGKVLVINELMTTPDGTTLKTKQAIETANPEGVDFIEYAVILAHRSKALLLSDGLPVLPVFHFNIDNYDPNPEVCPYCKAGSPAIKAKQPVTNWDMLQSESADWLAANRTAA